MKSFRQFLTEIQGTSGSWGELLKKKPSDNAVYAYHDIYSDLKSNMISEMLNKKKQRWNLIKAEELQRIYNEHKQFGFVKSEKLFDSIIERCIHNTAQIRVNTELAGHEHTDPYREYVDDLEGSDREPISEDEFHDLAYEYVGDSLSDYGLKWAEDIAVRLIDAKNDNQKIVLMNHLFDVVHQRTDFSEFYVVGGSATLSKISGTEHGREE